MQKANQTRRTVNMHVPLPEGMCNTQGDSGEV